MEKKIKPNITWPKNMDNKFSKLEYLKIDLYKPIVQNIGSEIKIA